MARKPILKNLIAALTETFETLVEIDMGAFEGPCA